MTHSIYRDVISGAARGLVADAARAGLKLASVLYGTAVCLRNGAYDFGVIRTQRARVPVVSIGNLTAGGTGKTPIVAAVVNWFMSHGVRPVILSRGYRAHSTADPASRNFNDEKLVLDQLCPKVVHLQDPNRVRSAAEACQRYGAEILILDDGFQHRRLARDLNLLLVDALDPWGAGHLLPRGLLREPLSALRRADFVILTRADLCAPEAKQLILQQIHNQRGDDPPAEVAFIPTDVLNTAGQRQGIDTLGNKIVAFCGIGNPEGFRRTLDAAGMGSTIANFRSFPDHHHYSPADLDALAQAARACGASALVTTQKDLVKIPRADLGGVPLWAVTIRAEILVGKARLDERLQALVPGNFVVNSSKFQ